MHTIPSILPPPPIPMLPSVLWRGANGRQYAFALRPIRGSLPASPGVYIFCKPALNGKWDAVYIGETENLERRLSRELLQHHRWPAIYAARATHVCTLYVPGPLAARIAIETDLRRFIQTPCNLQ